MDGEKAYRVEQRFQEAVSLFGPDHLCVTETAEGTYTLSAFHPNGVEYVLSTQRNPDEARQFSDLGRCVQFALKLTGISAIEFQLRATGQK